MLFLRSRAPWLLAASWLIACVSLTAQAATYSFSFDEDRAGAPPEGFTFAAVRQPTSESWLINRQGPRSYVVHQASQARGYALAVTSVVPPEIFALSGRVKLAGGARAGGLLWHYRDEANYSAVVLDLARRELSLFRFSGGNRVRLELEADLDLDPDAWHTLRVVREGSSVFVSLGGIRVFNDYDRRIGQRPGQGRVGFIATGDSEVWGDDLHIEPKGRTQ